MKAPMLEYSEVIELAVREELNRWREEGGFDTTDFTTYLENAFETKLLRVSFPLDDSLREPQPPADVGRLLRDGFELALAALQRQGNIYFVELVEDAGVWLYFVGKDEDEIVDWIKSH